MESSKWSNNFILLPPGHISRSHKVGQLTLLFNILYKQSTFMNARFVKLILVCSGSGCRESIFVEYYTQQWELMFYIHISSVSYKDRHFQIKFENWQKIVEWNKALEKSFPLFIKMPVESSKREVNSAIPETNIIEYFLICDN